MAFSSAPYPAMSMIGEADLIRHVYLPALVKSYVVWTSALGPGGSHFVISATTPEVPGAAFDDRIIAGPYQIRAFAVWETETANVILILYEDNEGRLWALTYNVATETVVSAPTLKYTGQHPSLSTDGVTSTIVSYLQSGGLLLRKGLDGIERVVVAPSASYVLDHDAHQKESEPYVVRYLGLHGPNPDVARVFVADGNTEALYDAGLSILEGGVSKLRDASGNNCHLTLGGTIEYNANGITLDGVVTPQATAVPMGVGLTIEAWLAPRFAQREAHLVSNANLLFGCFNTGMLYFSFYQGGAWKNFIQTLGRRLDVRDMNYVALSHTWGTGSSTFMVINGSVVPGAWVIGTGNENPGLVSLATMGIPLARGDVLKSFMLSSVAKTSGQIQDYTKGKV